MAKITIQQIQAHVETLKNCQAIGESSATECLVIEFDKKPELQKANVLDDEMVDKKLYFQSRNGHVSIDFDEGGLSTR